MQLSGDFRVFAAFLVKNVSYKNNIRDCFAVVGSIKKLVAFQMNNIMHNVIGNSTIINTRKIL